MEVRLYPEGMSVMCQGLLHGLENILLIFLEKLNFSMIGLGVALYPHRYSYLNK